MMSLSAKKSLFLFGPRSTGRTTLIRSQFSEDAIINLLWSITFLTLSQDPSAITGMVKAIRRTKHGVGVDSLIGDDTAIEVKSTNRVLDKHLKGLRARMEENLIRQFLLVSFDEAERETSDGIRVVVWESFLKKLWGDMFL